jgi:DNA polymerase III subunit gamma/tau
MSYQVIARKWRPQTFDDVSGQAHVTTPLRNAIRTGRVPHAILLSGPRGVGKTTLARILARCLNCDKGPTDTPCGECDPCREISAGTSTDVQEIDAASRTGVDDVRELIAAIRYAAAPGKHRIFVVDEVHMLSPAAFNALLKTLEEPPARSLFVFATTNAEKIPPTVTSRCQRYDLRRIRTSEIVERLAEITRAESISISSASLLAIAREADGSMRDAQTLLDQVIAYAGSQVDEAQVNDVLDLVDRRVLLRIATACIESDAAAALAACREAGEAGLDAKRLSETLLQLLRDLVVVRIAPGQPELIEASDEEIAELRALAERTDATRLRRMFRALVKEQEDLAWAPQPFAVLELAVVRLATMPDGDDVGRLLARLDALEKRLSGSDVAEGGAPPAAAGPATGASAGRAQRAQASRSEPKASEAHEGSSRSEPQASEDQRGSERSPSGGPSSKPRAPRSHAAPADGGEAEASDTAPPASDAPLGAVLDRLRAFARTVEPGIFAALDGAELLERNVERVRVRVPEAFAARRLRERQAAVDALAARFFGRATRVLIEDAPESAAASDAGAAQSHAARQRRQDALNDPAVGRALDILGADIVEIRPLGGGRS